MLQTPGNIRGSRSEDFHFLGAEKLSFELGFPEYWVARKRWP
jgi:hypothetical protein